MTIQEPALPAVPDYPVASPWTDRIDHTRQEFLDELATQDGWIDLGEKHGVRLSKKYRDHVRQLPELVRFLSRSGLGCGSSLVSDWVEADCSSCRTRVRLYTALRNLGESCSERFGVTDYNALCRPGSRCPRRNCR